MKRASLGVALVAAASMSLVGCAGMEDGPGMKEIAGTVLGAAAGGFAGSKIGRGNGKTIATIAGTMLGGFVGNSIGKSLDRADKAYANQAAVNSVGSGGQVMWQNNQSGNMGMAQPTGRSGSDQMGRLCREYVQVIRVGNKEVEGVGTACQNPDGSWQIVQGAV